MSIVPSLIYAQDKLSMDNEVKAYDTIFAKIAEKRVGADTVMIDRLVNPFVVIRDDNMTDSNGTSKPAYVLEAVINSKAKINGVWYAKNDVIGPYKLTKITRYGAILQNESEKKELLIRTKDESNIKIFAK